MPRFLCIHGHFYQPPRENPWLEAVEVQDSAYPYHDWNSASRRSAMRPTPLRVSLDGDGRIERIVNNYAQISFNFGPTLLAWLEEKKPEVYQAILAADAESRERFSGHGSALAQGYNHIIFPLANRRDKQAQIRWGLADFERRFGRKAEGLWLPETAVDLETLDLLAAEGILFTVLEPHQAKRVRSKTKKKAEWQEVSGGRVDTTKPYDVVLPSGRHLAVFFYDGGVSRAVAFEGLLNSGERFAGRLMATAADDPDDDKLIHIATDGETYGHHHRYGEMGLSYALHHVEANGLATLTNYGEYLAGHPPEMEARSSRTRPGLRPWRRPLAPGLRLLCRRASRLDPGLAGAAAPGAGSGLRDELAPRFAAAAGEFFPDPWRRGTLISDVLLDRSPANVDAFLARLSGGHPPEGERRVRALRLLEMQRHAMLMYTSCGWFFDDLSGIETVQILGYAGRVVQLAGQLFESSLEEDFLSRLERAKSNMAANGTGRGLYERRVRPAMVDPARGWLRTTPWPRSLRIFRRRRECIAYSVRRENGRTFPAARSGRSGRPRLAIGKVHILSAVTGKTADLVFGVLHFGDHNLNAGVCPYETEEGYQTLLARAGTAFEHGDLADVIRQLDRYFIHVPLFSEVAVSRRPAPGARSDPRLHAGRGGRRVPRRLREARAADALPAQPGKSLAKAFAAAAELVLSLDLKRLLEDPAADLEETASLLAQREILGVDLDTQGLSYTLAQALETLARRLEATPDTPDLLRKMASTVALARKPPFHVDLWRAQNTCYDLRQRVYPGQKEQAEAGDAAAAEWVEIFRELSGRLGVRVG